MPAAAGTLMNTPRRNWTREETILAFELYCRTPFGRIHKGNQDIVRLAEIIGRTPDAVAFKMCNLAHCDPALHARNVSGLAHGSKTDKEVFAEFSQSWDELAMNAQEILARMTHKTLLEVVEETLKTPEGSDLPGLDSFPAGDIREQVIKTRVGQDFFRKAVLANYGNACCITGIADTRLLIASHIKPWAVSNDRTEKLNPRNGLCLNALHDRAFDQGLITVDPEDHRIIISRQLAEVPMEQETREWLLHFRDQKIAKAGAFQPDPDFLAYHNENIFLK